MICCYNLNLLKKQKKKKKGWFLLLTLLYSDGRSAFLWSLPGHGFCFFFLANQWTRVHSNCCVTVSETPLIQDCLVQRERPSLLCPCKRCSGDQISCCSPMPPVFSSHRVDWVSFKRKKSSDYQLVYFFPLNNISDESCLKKERNGPQRVLLPAQHAYECSCDSEVLKRLTAGRTVNIRHDVNVNNSSSAVNYSRWCECSAGLYV